LHGLKKDFFNKKTYSAFDLVKKIGKKCAEARAVVDICQDLKDKYDTMLKKHVKLNIFGVTLSDRDISSPITKYTKSF
jgi:hypothetical protein